MKGPAERPLHVASPARRRHILRSESAKYVRCGDFVDALKPPCEQSGLRKQIFASAAEAEKAANEIEKIIYAHFRDLHR